MSVEKFRTLLWKNWILQKRHWKNCIIELMLPVLLVVFVTSLKKESSKDQNEFESSVSSYEIYLEKSYDCNRFSKIAFSPSSPWIEDFLNSIYYKELGIELKMFGSSKELDQYLNLESEELVMAIEFDDSLAV
jgi:ATP-binding cassette, subfamily A (ABC1), member 3